ncbi:MAG: hypothetical protein HUK21_08670 [Fibrobacteraceae bacterium]|nr:hypothetical protein [Fibrobacteraceae bacterium]
MEFLEFDINLENNGRDVLVKLKKCPKLKKGVAIVYIYSLVDKDISYPKKSGKIVYIGQACRGREATGKRFSQHIRSSAQSGGDTGANETLSTYYYNGDKLRLRILIVANGDIAKNLEARFFQYHVKEYGALPIADGTGGKQFLPSALNSLKIDHDEYEFFNRSFKNGVI